MLKGFFLPHGRIGRLHFWRAVAIIGIAYEVGLFAAIMIGFGIFKATSPIGVATITGVPFVIALWSAAMIGAQRLHDRDRAGWWLLLALVPIGGAIWYLFANGTIAGTPEQNRFGPPPGGGREIVEVFGDAESRPIGRRQAGVVSTIVAWVALLAVTGVTGLLFQNPSPRDPTPGVTAPR